VYLTFDDGPDPLWTPRILDELERVEARATFFVIGDRVREHPDIVRAARDAGHAVELHCMRHVSHSDAWRADVEADTRQALAVLAQLGIEPRRWRPPFGEVAAWTREVAATEGLELTGWTADAYDWLDSSTDELLARVEPGLATDTVVLLHDGLGPGARRASCTSTAALVEPLVTSIRGRGLAPAALGPGPLPTALIEHEPALEAPERGPVLHTPLPREEIAVVDEDRIDRGELALLGELLAGGFPRHAIEYRERAWRKVRPAFRVLARRRGRVAGQISAFRIATHPVRELFGIGDAVVTESARGQGMARQLVERSAQECRRRGAEVVLTDTLLLRKSFRAVGLEPVPRLGLYYERDAACHWHPHWMAWLRDGTPPPRLRLEEGDF
jgi:GNAT superfamily N-acetyltransferase